MRWQVNPAALLPGQRKQALAHRQHRAAARQRASGLTSFHSDTDPGHIPFRNQPPHHLGRRLASAGRRDYHQRVLPVA